MLSERPSAHVIESEVIRQISDILAEKDRDPGEAIPSVGRDRRLGDLGISSLDLAQLVAGLESSFGADPFQELVAITSVRSVADLCRAYEQCFSGEQVAAGSAELLESQRRAEERRAQSAARRGGT